VTDTHCPAPLSVLLVDDSGGGYPSGGLLRLLGYEVRAARSGAEALAVAGASPPDVAVLGPGLSDVDLDTVAEGLPALACRPLLVAVGRGVAGRSRGVEFDHVLGTADPAELAALMTDYALVVER
jgi:hypothetical protein